MKSLRRVNRTPGQRPEPSLKVVRAATVLGVVVPVYGLLRLLTGLFHWILPARILSAIPELVSDVHNTHAIASGVILFFLGLRLLKRQRFSYYASLLVLTASAISGLVIGVTPWFWSSGFAVLALLVPLRRAFTRQSKVAPTPGQIVGVIAVLLALGYGVVGAYLLRDQFTNLNTWGDAVYFAITTLTTLGYGDIVPVVGSAPAKFFAVSLVVVGISSFLTAISLVVVPFLESQTKEVMQAMDRFRKRSFRDHVIVCFYTQVGQSVTSQLSASHQEFLVVEPGETAAETLQSEGLRVLQGDPTDERTLVKANIDQARAVIACSDRDADNALITLIAHDVKTSGRNPRLRIVARIEQEQGVRKLEAAGADYVVSPSTIGGRMMGRFAAGESKNDILCESSDELTGADVLRSDAAA
jgi:voltage-gated potassium channel